MSYQGIASRALGTGAQLAFALVLAACTSERDPVGGTAAVQGTGVSGSAGQGGSDGSGGGDTSGSGGAGTTTAGPGNGGTGPGSSGAGPGSGGAGPGPGSGGAAATSTGTGIPDECGDPEDCGGDQPSECNASACNAPEFNFICEGTDDEPAAYGACRFAEEVYRTGIWARFVDCLRDETDPETQCNDGDALVEACVAAALAGACDNDQVSTVCDSIATACANEEIDFDIDGCNEDLLPFGENGFLLYRGCIDDPGVEGSCNGTHQECFDDYAPP